jgi:hypothetical protein
MPRMLWVASDTEHVDARRIVRVALDELRAADLIDRAVRVDLRAWGDRGLHRQELLRLELRVQDLEEARADVLELAREEQRLGRRPCGTAVPFIWPA